MSGGFSTTTNPWANSSGNDTLSLLKEHGYNAVETLSGKYSVDLGNGQKVEFEKWEPLWTVLNRIESAKTNSEETKSDDNIIAKWAEKETEAAKEAMQKGKIADKLEDTYSDLLSIAKDKLDGLFRNMFKKFNITDKYALAEAESEAPSLQEQRELHEAIKNSNKYEGDINENAKLKLHYNIEAHNAYSSAFMHATDAMKFSYMG